MLLRSKEMLHCLPPFMRQSAVYKAIFDAISIAMQSDDESIQDIQRQFCMDTATWGLAVLYEQDLAIATDLAKPLYERRAVIKSKMRGTGKIDVQLIKMVADSYTQGDVEVTFHNSNIQIRFTSVKGIPTNIEDVKQIIEEIKPAHLSYTLAYTYTVWRAVKPLTWKQVHQKTWDQLRIYEECKSCKEGA